jgi:hypothetical protein
MIPLPLSAQMRISVSFGPPAIPVYEQPLCPGEGYIWTPGYWAWDDVEADYYWVPGTWVLAGQQASLLLAITFDSETHTLDRLHSFADRHRSSWPEVPIMPDRIAD